MWSISQCGSQAMAEVWESKRSQPHSTLWLCRRILHQQSCHRTSLSLGGGVLREVWLRAWRPQSHLAVDHHMVFASVPFYKWDQLEIGGNKYIKSITNKLNANEHTRKHCQWARFIRILRTYRPSSGLVVFRSFTKYAVPKFPLPNFFSTLYLFTTILFWLSGTVSLWLVRPWTIFFGRSISGFWICT